MSNSNVASKTDLVKLRSRKTSNGRASLYLDYVQYNERVRDTLGLFLLSGKSPEVKEKNQKTMAKAELLRLEKEKELLKEYCDYLLDFKDVLADWAGRDTIDCARKLWIHEHEMYLTTVEDFDIDLSNATTPGFFEQTGLMVYERDKCCMLEDLMVC